MKYSLRSLIVIGVAIVAFLLGAVADRAYLNANRRTPDARLIGDWTGDDGNISFRPDGTYEAAFVFTATANGSITKTKQEPYTAQYRWVGGGEIEIYVPLFAEWLKQKPVFDGDKVALLGADGSVARYTRKLPNSQAPAQNTPKP